MSGQEIPKTAVWTLTLLAHPEWGATVSGRKLFIAGHRGMVGSALWRRYQRAPGWDLVVRTRAELELTDAESVGVRTSARRVQLLWSVVAFRTFTTTIP